VSEAVREVADGPATLLELSLEVRALRPGFDAGEAGPLIDVDHSIQATEVE
jgi:hypothetical protein